MKPLRSLLVLSFVASFSLSPKAADAAEPVSTSLARRKPAPIVERHYKVNRFAFFKNLLAESGGDGTQTSEAMLERLFKSRRIEAQVILLSEPGEKLSVRGTKKSIEGLWKLLCLLNGCGQAGELAGAPTH